MLKFFRKRKLEAEMQEEMRLHLATATQRLIARGLTPNEAAVAARREFGNVPAIQEDGRDARGGRWLDELSADVRFALRYFARTPLTTIVIVLILALGLGANSALFTFGQAVLFRVPSGITTDPAVVRVMGTYITKLSSRPNRIRDLSWPEIRDLQAQPGTFSEVAAWSAVPVVIVAKNGDEARASVAEFATPDLLPMMGARIELGRGLPLLDSIGDPQFETVIAHAQWMTVYGGATSVLGQQILVNGVPVRIVGVAAAPFNGLEDFSSEMHIWLPVATRATILKSNSSFLTNRDSTLFSVMARIVPGSSWKHASMVAGEIGGRSNQLMSPSKSVESYGLRMERLGGLRELTENGDFSVVALLFGGGALLILLIVCTNVSALMVGAGVARQQEVAVRLSLGASRWRIMRQLLTESVLLSLAAGILGVLAYLLILHIATAGVVSPLNLVPDWGTIGFTTGMALLTGMVFGLSPALHATRAGMAPILKGSGGAPPARTRLQRGFLITQIALTQPLLVGLGFIVAAMGQNWARQGNRNAEQHVMEIRVPYLEGGDQKARAQQIDRVFLQLSGMPGITGVVPGSKGYSVTDIVDADSLDATTPTRLIENRGTVPGYLPLLGIALSYGRDFEWRDTLAVESPVIIGPDLASELWGMGNPIGRRLGQRIGGKLAGSTMMVIGVTKEKQRSGRSDRYGVMTLASNTGSNSYLVGSVALASAARNQLQEFFRNAAPGIPFELRTLEEVSDSRRLDLVRLSLATGGGGVLALLLASIGLYGVVSLMVGQRRREIGIRIAIGAHPGEVVMLLLRNGLKLGAIGLVLGLPFSLLVLQLLTSQPGAPAVNTTAIGLAIGTAVLLVSALASWIPARRAANVHPMEALRG